MQQFPTHLEIPSITAASLTFAGGATARDAAILLAVAWYAGQVGLSEDGTVEVPDLPLRRLLGDMRASDEGKRDARHMRFETLRLRTDERLPDIDIEGVDAPTVQAGMRRILIKGAYRWSVDPAVVAAFEVQPGEPIVKVPSKLLAQARCRYTLPLYLRARAWRTGDVEPSWVLVDRKSDLRLRVPLSELKVAIGMDPGVRPTDVERHALGPASREIAAFTDTVLDHRTHRAPSLRAAGGRALAVDLAIGEVEVVRVRPRRGASVTGTLGRRPPAPAPNVVSINKPFPRTRRKVVPIELDPPTF